MNYLGNISLLDLEKHGFLCSRCTRSSVILPCLDWAVGHAHGDAVVMSTFHSEMEDAVLDMLLAGTCPIILVLGRSLYKVVPEKLRPALDAGRLLIVSINNQVRISRDSAYAANEYICQHSDAITFGYLSHDSSLRTLYEKVVQNKQVQVITSTSGNEILEGNDK